MKELSEGIVGMRRLPTEAKQILHIALPAVGEAYLLNLLGVVDALFIAQLGLAAIDAVGVTNVYSMTYNGVFIAVSTALSVFVSRSVGAKEFHQSKSFVGQGLLTGFGIGLIFGVLSLLFSGPLLHIMGADGTLATAAGPYFLTVLGSSPLIALFTAQSAAFRAIGDTRTPLKIGLEMNIVHVILDYILIFGLGFIPGLGLLGAGIAMVAARLYALLRLWVKSRSIDAISLTARHLRLQPTRMWRMVRFAVPSAFERLSMRLGQVLYFGLIVRMGIDVYATHNIAGTLTAFASTIGGGFATAATATIGQAIGGHQMDDAKAYRKWSYRLSASSMTLVTALLAAASPWIGRWFTHDATVLGLLTIVLIIDTFSQPFLAAVLVDTAAIQVGGNSKYPMWVTTIGIWGIRTLGVYVFAWKMGFGLPAVWICIACDNALRALLFARYRAKNGWIRNLA